MKDDGAEKGWTSPGKPTSTHEDKMNKMRQGDLLDTRLGEVENLAPTGHNVGGFLKRNNFGDRF